MTTRATLTLFFRDRELACHELQAGETSIGSDPACDIHIDSLAVEPRHAVVHAEGASHVLHRATGTASLRVNGEDGDGHALQDGDRIELGKHHLAYRIRAAQSGGPRPAAAVTPLTGWLQITTGPHVGRSIRLERAITRFGRAGAQSCMISRRGDGYYLAHLEGEIPPRVNDSEIGPQPVLLHDGDRLEVAGTGFTFSLDGGEARRDTSGGTPDSQPQRRFTRIGFEAAVALHAGADYWRCDLIDLSIKGALVRLPADCPCRAGDQFQLVIVLDETTRIEMEVSVAHRQDDQAGLACTGLDMNSAAHLRRLLELNLGDARLLERELAARG